MTVYPLISSEDSWVSRASAWGEPPTGRRLILLELEVAKALISAARDIGSISVDVDVSDVNKVDDKMNALKVYADNIHNEIYLKIDDLFTIQMQGYSGICYKLNPSQYKLEAASSNTGDDVGIGYFLLRAPIDVSLKAQYLGELIKLSFDRPSEEAKDVYRDDLWQWHEQVSFEDLKGIDRIIYAAQGSIIASDGTVLSANNPAAELMYEMSPFLVIKDNSFTGTAHYSPSESGIYINMEDEATNVQGAYAVFFHEMGHMIDNTLPEIIQGQDISRSHNPYLSVDYCSSGNELYGNIVSDVHGYIDNYNTSHGTSLSEAQVANRISTDLRGAAMGEVSDLFGGVTNNQVMGNWGHHDDPVTGSYWNFNTTTGLPDQAPLDKEAFAHFFEISLVQNQSDIDALQTYLPNAYQSYGDVLSEAKEALDASRV